MTGPELHDYLVRLGMEAWERAEGVRGPGAGLDDARAEYARCLRERMAQAAAVVVLEMEPRK